MLCLTLINDGLTDRLSDCSMVSGGADATIHLWDLEARSSELDHIHAPVASGNK